MASRGSAGRPPRQTDASASVAPNDSVMQRHVSRRAEPEAGGRGARNSAKKSRSGRPRFAAPLARDGNANETS